MSHKWNPKTDPVGKHEPVGRRLYDEPMLMGAQDQPSFTGLDYRHFEETRSDKQLSLDRLGCTGIEKKAKNYLKPRAEAEGAKRVPPKQFNGWAHLQASVLEKGWKGRCFPVRASPVEGEGLEENTHHAHVNIEDDATFAALYLRELFTRRGAVERIELPETVEKTELPKAAKAAGISGIVVDFFGSLWRGLTQKPPTKG
jgi:hypothetical protein